MRFVILVLTALCSIFAIDVGAVGHASATVGSGTTLGSALFYLGLGGAVVVGAVLDTGGLTMADIAKRLDPNDRIARIIELLMQKNQILEDMRWIEGNLVTGNRTTVRTGLPQVFWRLLNQGVPTSKSHTAQIDEQCGMLEAYSQVDRDLAELGGNLNAVRLSEARPFIEAMNQELASTLFYGAASSPEEFIGLAPRYSSLTAPNGSNIISAAGSGADNTSIWLIAWDEETVCGIYPKGSTAGLFHEDLGLETVENAGGVAGRLMRAYRDHWQWKAGIALKDWRYVIRICNVDVSDLGGATPADLIDAMEQAEEIIPDELGTRAFYMNRTVRRFLRKQYRTDVASGGGLTYENVGGKRVTMFGTTPVRISDAILNTEAAVA